MVKSLRVAMFLALRAVVKGNVGVTILTIVMLILVALNLLFVPGLIAGAIVSANDILVRTFSGDLLVEAEGDNPRISHVEDLILGIESIDGVAAVAARNSMAAEITF
ncbi:MAG: hypothetical protein KAW81_00060, partial [Dehalococcoidia bacterium]|nr:hypothetical protein [Dehalococcoidia bacterium]